MDLIRLALDRPTAVIAAVIMVVTFGIVALETIPIQMTPDVRRPVIVITTSWPGAAPAEVEREITNRVEEELTGVPGLREMLGLSQLGRSRLILEFDVDQDMREAFLLVSNRLNAISNLPVEADEPTMRTSSSEDRPIARLAIRRLPGNQRDIETYGDFILDVVVDRLERVSGVSQVGVSGGSERELRIIIAPEKLAQVGLTVPEVVEALRGANATITAGSVEEGKRRYVVRTEAETRTEDQARNVVLRVFDDPATGRMSRITIGDIGRVEFGYKEPTSRRRFLGEPAITLRAIRETGANVIDTMVGVRAAVAQLNQSQLQRQELRLDLIYDETVYIESAIQLVQQNIYVGGTLAALVLLVFLRSLRATLVVSLAIPVSVIGTFVAMAALGRSINVISLAGIAFAVGMVVDAAIVVLENIYRHCQTGLPVRRAAYEGAKQVKGAVTASALTTVVVFVPLLVLKLPIGQLFRDIAVAIAVAVLISLMVSMTLIPVLGRRLLAKSGVTTGARLRLPVIDHFARWFVAAVLATVRATTSSAAASILVVLAICGAAAVATYSFLPKLDYLPEGNRNFVFGRIQPPPGYNLEASNEVAERIETVVRPLWASESGSEAEPGGPPKIRNFFFVTFRDQTRVGASAVDPSRAGELIPILRGPVFDEPGTRGFITQSSLFGRSVGGSRSINLDISGVDLEQVLAVAQRADALVRRALPPKQGTQVRPVPGLELGAPEIRIVPDPVRIADAGLSARELGLTIDAYNDGLRVAEITLGGRRLDLVLQGPERNVLRTQGISNLPVVTRRGVVVPASTLADIEVTAGPTEIRHLDRARTVTLQIRPDKRLALESAIALIQREVIGALRNEGLPPDIVLALSGVADDLSVTWDVLKWSLIVAFIVVYLVIAVLFESFVYPLIIMLSVPLATAGGVGGLAVLNLYIFQPLDMLTMFGFVILVGIVVNNAILLVDQTLYHLRVEGLRPQEAILASTENRIRPIFMSTLTSIFGLMPLVVFPGAGSELYRGLGSVVVGGLSLSAVLTLLIIPPLLSLFSKRMTLAAPALPDGRQPAVGE
jgi:HAE1 family hydrophobic/amphiphilic exporter-1